MTKSKKRCLWAGSDQLMIAYHDTEWGVPVHDDKKHFEFLILEGAQAGLSWSTVLKKREGYLKAFSDFDPQKIAKYNSKKIEKLMLNAGIIRNRLKIESTVSNAKQFIKIQQEFGSFDSYCWQFVDDKPKINSWKSHRQIPATTHESDIFSKDLKMRGFKFIGSTVIYAYMQAVGMVNDHTVDCFRHHKCR